MASGAAIPLPHTTSVCVTLQHPLMSKISISKQTRSGHRFSVNSVFCKSRATDSCYQSIITRRIILIGLGAQAVRFDHALAAEKSTLVTPNLSFPVVLDRAVTAKVARKNKLRSRKEKNEEEEILVIKGIEFEGNRPVKFDVYVNELGKVYGNPETSEFAGSFVNVPHNKKGKKKTKTVLKLGLTELLEDLGAENDDNILVTLVPTYGKGEVKIGGIKVDFVKD